jgi:hypothetical protein
MHSFRRGLQLLCALLALAAAPCPAAASDAMEDKLANGLRVIVKPDRRAPVRL